MLESALDRLAQQILGLDEASLSSSGKNTRSGWNISNPRRMGKGGDHLFHHQCDPGKNHIFNEQLMRRQQQQTGPEKPRRRNRSCVW